MLIKHGRYSTAMLNDGLSASIPHPVLNRRNKLEWMSLFLCFIDMVILFVVSSYSFHMDLLGFGHLDIVVLLISMLILFLPSNQFSPWKNFRRVLMV